MDDNSIDGEDGEENMIDDGETEKEDEIDERNSESEVIDDGESFRTGKILLFISHIKMSPLFRLFCSFPIISAVPPTSSGLLNPRRSCSDFV